MEKKRILLLVVFVLFVIAGFTTYFLVYTKQQSIQGNVIVNGRDSHGCLVDSGYKWNEEQKSCINDWLSGDLKYQVTDFQSCKDAGYAISENNETKSLQCQALNGTMFMNTSQIVQNNASIGNGSTVFVGNFTINQTNLTNENSMNLTNNS